MIPLPETFKKNGFSFWILSRSGSWALLSKSHRGQSRPSFEVVRIERRAEHTWPNGQTSLAHEALPAPEDWGTAGFTFTTLTAARAKFDEVSARARFEEEQTHDTCDCGREKPSVWNECAWCLAQKTKPENDPDPKNQLPDLPGPADDASVRYARVAEGQLPGTVVLPRV